jgi:acetate kinase
MRINQEILAELDQLVPLAPLHQPHNLRPIRVIMSGYGPAASGLL